MNAQFRRVKEVFLAAVEKGDPAERGAYLCHACGPDEELRRQVDALLARHVQAGSLLEPPSGNLADTVDDPACREYSGTVIGPYELLEPIGEGGMGTVWMARQAEPVRRKVAVKLVKPGMSTRHVVARFEAERQALALMDHPNIAKVHDAGTTADGLPYFVMELVKGVPITRYCDEARLTPRERLGLFVPVCQAIQHAHQKGVIHRDVKPSNVLVALYDGKPVPKVIDFGVAKATGQQLTEDTLQTGFGAVVGTLEYMSPEQASLDAVDVDTRSDVYSLGVLLYELLTGGPPFSREELRKAGLAETLRLIREREPTRPSVKLSTADGLPALAASRGAEPGRLAAQVRGELDWIVMKALEKDRARRYESAGAFAEDVGRYLLDLPVKACPPSRGYRFRKFARRNKAALSAGVLVLAMLVATVTTLGISTVRIAEERNAAREAAREARTEGAKAERERRRADANLAKARKLVDDVLTGVAWDLTDVPRTEQVRKSLLSDAVTFYKGFLQEGVAEPAIRLETALAYHRLADIHDQLEEGAAGEKYWQEAIGILRELVREYPDGAEYREELAICYAHLGGRYQASHRSKEAFEAHGKSLALFEGLVADFPGVLKYRGRLVSCMVTHAKLLEEKCHRRAEADACFRRVFQVREKALRDFPTVPVDAHLQAYLHWGYGWFQCRTSNLPEAETHLRRAVQLYQEAIERSPGIRPGYSAGLLSARADLARVLVHSGRHAEAEPHLLEAIKALEARVKESPHVVEYRAKLAARLEQWGLILFGLGRAEEAERTLRKQLELIARLHEEAGRANPEHAKGLAWSHFHLGELLRETGRPGEAAGQFRQARGLFEGNAERLPDLSRSHYQLAWALAACPDPALRDPARAVRHAERAVENGSEVGAHWTCLGIARYRAGQWQAAVQAFEKALRLHPEPDGYEWFFQAMAQWRLGHREQARQAFASGVKWVQQRPNVELELKACRREAAALLGIESQEAPALETSR